MDVFLFGRAFFRRRTAAFLRQRAQSPILLVNVGPEQGVVHLLRLFDFGHFIIEVFFYGTPPGLCVLIVYCYEGVMQPLQQRFAKEDVVRVVDHMYFGFNND